eukprot:CAMPEP_0119038764 /NCGR_PEP_ID=MMETSP1177-20130426/7880_1 /TAXON_ID=2985 /ORGANISM="Ochromonas sp, Strain CCMP1899" /LENGTH=59 /DNA_ID=CAMNT_0007001773 /DNA_START=110 /DNA_END=286 /DNA_ORIENTATION=+
MTERLIKGAEEGNLLEVISCLQDGVDVDSKDEDGQTPLMLTASRGHLDMVKYLIEERNA